MEELSFNKRLTRKDVRILANAFERGPCKMQLAAAAAEQFNEFLALVDEGKVSIDAEFEPKSVAQFCLYVYSKKSR